MLLDYERMSEANEVSQSRERNVVEFPASCLNIDVLPICGLWTNKVSHSDRKLLVLQGVVE